MRLRVWALLCVSALIALPGLVRGGSPEQNSQSTHSALQAGFRTSDRCVACHNGLKTSSGEDISIGFRWRASIMANSARDPYWQGSVRRETLDHPESTAAIQDECSTCHMPVAHLAAKSVAQKTEVFANFPQSSQTQVATAAMDGVSCSVCHQIEKAGLGTNQTFNGNVVVASPENKDQRPEYGPFDVDAGHREVMHSSTGGFVPEQAAHIRDSALCGSCHTLITKALGPGGKEIGRFPEQMPYQEWLHSSYANTEQTCQSCHMPEVHEAVPITAVFGQPREGMHRHDFVGANFFMLQMLQVHRQELAVSALPEELAASAERTADFLINQFMRVNIRSFEAVPGRLSFDIAIENLTGHKFPTAYPSRRAWLHVKVLDRDGQAIFVSGALRPDGSIGGNRNDADPRQFEPHHREITSSQQVQIFEPILKDSGGNVTTGLLSAVGYLKDNRILPKGFDKRSADADIAVIGDAAEDPRFMDGECVTRYLVETGDHAGPFHVEAELWYQPIGFRWAHNLEPYKAMEPQRFLGYFESASRHSAIVLAKTQASR